MLLYGDESDPDQAEALAAFRRIEAEFSGCIDFFQPSPERAPWHVQGRVKPGALRSGYTPLVNLWPHRGVAHVQGRASVEGEAAIRELLVSVLDDEPVEPLFE